MHETGQSAALDAFFGPEADNFVFTGGGPITATTASLRSLVSPTAASTLATDGTPGNDTIIGTSAADVINGLAGDDSLMGMGGNDTLSGGAGNDRLDGGTGKDRIDGGNGKDLLKGANDSDRLAGGAGNDTLSGGSGSDSLNGGLGNDRLTGGAGADDFHYGASNEGRDTITDFVIGEDLIELRGVSATDFSVDPVSGGTRVTIEATGTVITLVGLDYKTVAAQIGDIFNLTLDM
jgi:Ca2+-binding RTX toxin-like protein